MSAISHTGTSPGVMSPNHIHVESRPRQVAGTKLCVLDGHVLCAHSLRVDAIKERDGTAGKDARRDVACFRRLFGRFRNNGDRCRIKGRPNTVGMRIGGLVRGRRQVRLADLECKLETFGLGCTSNVQIFKIRDHVIVEWGSLIGTSFAVLGDDAHGELLGLQHCVWRFNAHYGWGTEEPLLATVRLLGDGGVKANDGSHGQYACIVHDNVIADGPSELGLGFLHTLI